MSSASLQIAAAAVARPTATPFGAQIRGWDDAPAAALDAVLHWIGTGAEPLVAVDADARVMYANAAFARAFALAPAGPSSFPAPRPPSASSASPSPLASASAERAPLARWVPLLTAPRLRRWIDESAGASPTRRVHRLLAEASGADGDRFLVAATLVPACSGPAGTAPGGLACVVGLRPLDLPRGLVGTAPDEDARAADSVALGALLDAALRALPSAADRRRCRLEPHAADARVAVDPAPVLEALRRVVDNACRYSAPTTTVVLRSHPEAADPDDGPDARARIVITVADRGRGLSRADRQRVFEPFRRAAPQRGDGGQGLGLAVARHLVDGQGGWIELRSAPGVGTEVELHLPAA